MTSTARLLRGLGALLALVLGVVGIPVALVLLGGNPLPNRLSWASLSQALLHPDDGTVLLGLISVLGWLAWAVFAVSLVAEVVAVVSRQRIRFRLPGLEGPQRLAAGLLVAVLAMAVQAPAANPAPPSLSATQASGAPEQATRPRADPAGPATTSTTSQPAVPQTPSRQIPSRQTPSVPAPTVQPSNTGSPQVTHVVRRGDDLWTLAEQYYGQGRDWRRIAAANPDVLSGGPDRLQIGWRLSIPDVDPVHEQPGSVVVRSGDSLSSIAEAEYGDASKWRALYAANRSQIEDPDEIAAGLRLKLPAEGEVTGQPDDPHRARPSKSTGQPPAERRDQVTPQSEESPPKRSLPAEPLPPGRDPATAPPDGPQPTTVPPVVAATPGPATAATAESSAKSPAEPQADQDAPRAADTSSPADVALGLGAVGGLLAAGLLGGLAFRRRMQLQARPLGRRIVHPTPQVQRVETALGRRQNPLSLRTLDLAVRAVAAHCRDTSVPVPSLVLAKVAPRMIELVMSEPTEHPPVGFRAVGRSWVLEQQDAGYLTSVPGIGEATRPYPALVSLGEDADGQQVLVNLEAMGVLALEPDAGWLGEALLAAMAVEMSFSVWSDEMFLTLVGPPVGLPDALGQHNVTQTEQLDPLLDRLEQRATAQRAHSQDQSPRLSRIDPDLADPWAPEILLIRQPLNDEQAARLTQLMTSEPRATLAAVVSTPLPAARWKLALRTSPATPDGGDDAPPAVSAVLEPLGLRLRPQLLEAPASDAVVELVATTGTDATTPAPWWDHGGDPPSVPPPDNVTYLGKRFGGWGSDSEQVKEWGDVPQQLAETDGAESRHPILRLLGPIDLLGANGTVPPRAGRQCLEYCCWLLEHPGTTAHAMAAALVVAEGTRRSNMSRLRSWLGADDQGNPYLPDAYTGRILLHPSVSSDWQRLQILTAPGVNKTSTGGLLAALELVRGAPLADAAPGQWHWAEELRTDMVSVIRDIGVEVTTRALVDNDIDLARWAAARALVAAPGDELLMAARIRTEHRAGNLAETERLTLQLAAQARSLGVDLDSATVVLLQEVMEGRVRARWA